MWEARRRQGKSIVPVKRAESVVLGLRSVVIDRNWQGLSMFCHRPANLPFKVLAAFSHSALDDGLTLVGHMAGAGLRRARRSSSCQSSQIGDITLSALRPCTGQAGIDVNCWTDAPRNMYSCKYT